MNAMPQTVAVVEPHEVDSLPSPPPPVSDTAALLSVIERAALDPRVDIDKMERLMAMREREMTRGAERLFNEAMKAAQAEMRSVAADADNSQTKSKYATYAKLDSVLRPIYTKHGFSVSFDEADSPKPDHIRCLAYVAHEAGFTRTYRKDMPADGKGAKGGDVMTKTHATGAASSYGQRYLLKGIFNVAVGEDDNDGNGAGPEAISEEQEQELRKLIIEVDADLPKFLTFLKIEKLSDLPAKQFERAKRALIAKQARKASESANG